jgi:hypothetical protein
VRAGGEERIAAIAGAWPRRCAGGRPPRGREGEEGKAGVPPPDPPAVPPHRKRRREGGRGRQKIPERWIEKEIFR